MSEFLQIANSFGDIDIQHRVPDGHQHVEGPRLQQICRKLGIPYGNALVGWGGSKKYPRPLHDGVVVPIEAVSLLRQEISEREKRSEKRRLCEQRKKEEQLAQAKVEAEQNALRLKRERLADFIQRFPAATDATIEKYAVGVPPVFGSLVEVPLNLLTETEIEELRLVKGAESGVLLTDSGRTLEILFSAQLPADESQETPEEVHRRATAVGFSAHKALWIVNKFVKIVVSAPKAEVYSLKDQLLKLWAEFLIEGRVARKEEKTCWNCGGTGNYDCYRCDGTGIYSSRTLYELRFQFPSDERVYCYHGYSKPDNICNLSGADKSSYGYRFSPDERKSIPFGFHDLIKIMKHEITLIHTRAHLRERDELFRHWADIGLPPLRLEVATCDIRACIEMITRLTVG